MACSISYVHRPVAASPLTVGQSIVSQRLTIIIGPEPGGALPGALTGIAKATEVLSAPVARQASVEPVDCWPVAIVIRTHSGESSGR